MAVAASRWLLLTAAIACMCLPQETCAKPPCPAQAPCQCTEMRVKCVQQESQQLHYLDALPYFVPNNRETRWSYSFHELRVRGHAMTTLTLRYDWGVINVRRVEVTNSLVRAIHKDAFRGLLGVESLNVSHNLLSNLSADDLRDLPSLRELVLHNNLIKMLQPGVFRHSLFIAKLYLSHNLLTEIPPDVRQLLGLTHLYLQYNAIWIVRDNAFSGLRKLIILDLGALKSGLTIQRRAFCGLVPENPEDSGLVALYLRRNILNSLDLCTIGQARSLRGLNLTGTFFPCTCQSLAFADRADWQRRFGFSPRFVTFESSLLTSCDPPDCGSRACRDACPGPASASPSVSGSESLHGASSSFEVERGVGSHRAESSSAGANRGHGAAAAAAAAAIVQTLTLALLWTAR